MIDAAWPNFPRVNDPALWEFRTGIYLNGAAGRGRPDFAATVAEFRPDRAHWPDDRPSYAWDEDGAMRWLHQAADIAAATEDRRPWLSVFPYCGTTGDVDHLLPDCPSVRAAQRQGVRVHWGIGLLEVDGTDVCEWCRRVYRARSRRPS